jgi:energy-coupling factor transporter ATP-binding protein EcfA2
MIHALTERWRASGVRELWHATSPRLVSAPQMSSGWQQQCEEALGALEERGGVLYMGRLVEALDAGRAEGTDYTLARLLKPWLDGRRVRLVAEATEAEWARIQREDAGLAGAFFALRVEELDPERGVRVIERVSEGLEEREGVEISPRALVRAWGLQRRFATHGSPVGRTIDFLASVARRVSNRGGGEVTERVVVTAFCEGTGLPEFMLLDERALDLDDVARTLSERVLGQDAAVRRVAEVIAITKAGMASPKKPLGTFLFVGPTGVGKTELARALSAFLFGDEARMIRLDMSEYSGPDAFAKLIGDGNEEGALSGPVRQQPFSVVLLDEIEKAHASAFDVLLQVLGEARLTDAAGRVTRFQNTIVIMTSNLGVDTLRPSIGFGGGGAASAGQHFRREAERFFRPEFLARVDELIPFGSLDPGVVRRLAARELEGVRARWGMARPGVSFEYDPELAGWLVERGFDPKYGARPLKRVVERAVVWPLAERLARANASGEDGVHVRAGLKGGEIAWEIARRPRSQVDERAALIERIERISQLRRRLDAYTWTELFADLEWQLASYEQRSVLEDFWQDPDASEVAARAERSRRVVEPARALALELAALEDLAHEAYYDEQFALAEDLRERLDELEPALRELFVVLLRSAYDDPDRVLVVLRAMPGARDARAELEGWYADRAARRSWSLRRFVPRDEGGGEEEPEAGWRELDDDEEPPGEVLMLYVEGEATRPLFAPEDGLHRVVSGTRGQAVADVICVSEHVGWPDARAFDAPRSNPATARVWNLRKGEVTIPFVEVIPFDPERPWRALEGHVEELAWVMLEGPDWEDDE